MKRKKGRKKSYYVPKDTIRLFDVPRAYRRRVYECECKAKIKAETDFDIVYKLKCPSCQKEIVLDMKKKPIL